jgi:hypothetical protein
VAEHHASDYTAPTVDVDYPKLKRVAFLSAVGGFVAWAALGAAQYLSYGGAHGGVRDFFLTYLVGYVYWLSIAVGAMALSFLGFVTSSSWRLVLARYFQAATRTWPALLPLFVPIAVGVFLGEESPYWWSVDADKIEEWTGTASQAFIEEQGHRQHMYLNVGFFLVRAVAIFGLYMVLSHYLNKWAVKAEDEGDDASRANLRGLSGPAVLLWALTWTVLITDLIMSVEVSWASSMFPVITGMNSFLCAMAFSAVMLYTIVGRNVEVLSILKDKFRIDIGSLIYGFTMVWTYATFCQYMLIWAGNLPEEITYPLKRTSGGWGWMALLLLVVHWFLPFVILLFRGMKTDPVKMRRICVMLLVICAVDVTWWIVPAVPHAHQWLHVPMAAAAVVGVGGVWGLMFLHELGKRNVLARKSTAFLAEWGHH